MRTKTTASDAQRWAASQLAGRAAEPARDAQILLSAALGRSAAQLLAHPQAQLPKLAWQRYRALIGKRRAGWPVAYLTGVREFYGRPFAVTPATLIPRPETELLVELAVKQNTEHRTQNTGVTIVDVGTGSGCIAVTLAAELGVPIIATDVSPRALKVARANARRHGVAKLITFLRGSLLSPLIRKRSTPRLARGRLINDERSAIVVANLPYLPANHPASQTPREPRLALYGGAGDGLGLIERLVDQCRDALRRPATGLNIQAVILEVDPRNAVAAKRYLNRQLPGGVTALHRDLTGRRRALVWQKDAR